MCGIAGIVRFDGEPVLEQEVRAMCATSWCTAGRTKKASTRRGVGARHAAAEHHRPRQRPAADLATRTVVWVVFNGEIYNYQELRHDCSNSAATASDLQRHRNDRPPLRRAAATGCVEQLRGMFAFAIWDDTPRGSCCSRATASASSRSTTSSCRTGWPSPRSSSRCCSCPRSAGL